MNESFINKYKPTNIENMFLNGKIKELITTVMVNRNVNILLHGNNETGKTILMNMLNKKITKSILINNLKENGINTFRTDIKLYCQLTEKKKTILIDDYDRITESSQYIIKTLMDKYENILFISTIKDIKKLIEPLKHKFFVVKLDNITNEFLKKLMNIVLENENIQLSEKTKDYIINISEFSINRMYNYLEKIKLLEENKSHKEYLKILTNISYYTFDNILILCKEKKKKDVYIEFNNIFGKGYSILDIFDFFFKFIKNVKNIDESIRYKIIKLLCEYISICDSINEVDTELLLFSYELVELF